MVDNSGNIVIYDFSTLGTSSREIQADILGGDLIYITFRFVDSTGSEITILDNNSIQKSFTFCNYYDPSMQVAETDSWDQKSAWWIVATASKLSYSEDYKSYTYRILLKSGSIDNRITLGYSFKLDNDNYNIRAANLSCSGMQNPLMFNSIKQNVYSADSKTT